MAVTETLAAQMASTYRRYPIDDMGKLRVLYGKITQGAAAGDDGSSVVIGDLPPGRVRILPQLCRYKVSALGASRVMKVGHDLYYDNSQVGDTGEPADLLAFMSAVDVSAATNADWPVLAAALKFDVYSRAGVRLRATITGGTIPAAATFEFVVVFVAE